MVRGRLLYKTGYQQTFNSTLPDRQWDSKAPYKGSLTNFSLTGVSLTPDASRGDKSRENTSLNVWREHTTQCRENTVTLLNIEGEHTAQSTENIHSMYSEHIAQCGEDTQFSV